MSKAQNIIDKLSNKYDDLDKNNRISHMLAGAAGGAVGAVATQFIDTVSNVKQQRPDLHTTKQVKDFLRQEALSNTKLSKTTEKLISNVGKLTPNLAKNLLNHLKVIKRYNLGLGAKLLKIAPATGISFGVYNYLTENLD